MEAKHKERLQFDFSPEALRRLDEMKENTQATTRAEVVRDALRVYEWLVSEVDPDNTIKVFDKKNNLIASFSAKLLLK